MSGSIACYKACDVISKLVQQGHQVQVVVTKDVFNFVGEATLEGLSGKPVLSDIYKSGDMMSHIHLNDWCDISVLCPATANTLVKTSLGLSDNLVSALSLSADPAKPYLIFPAMNTRMLSAEPTQIALRTLELKMHRQIIYGESGHLACGHQGSGRLAEPQTVLNSIQSAISTSSKTSYASSDAVIPSPELQGSKPKILITAGGTSEPIDPVRLVSNTSSGETGLKIAQHLSDEFAVILLGSESMKAKVLAQTNSQSLKLAEVVYFKSFKDLELKLSQLLASNNYEAVVHLAAVSDYTPTALHLDEKSIALPSEEKISISEDFFVEFKKNKKLISEIKQHSKNKNIKVIGFKLLRTDDQETINKEIAKILKDSDCVVVNSLENIDEKKHIYEIYNLSGLVFHGNTKADMAEDISKILQGEVGL